MNYKVVSYYLGRISLVGMFFMLLPIAVGLFYAEYTHLWTFSVSIAVYFVFGVVAVRVGGIKNKGDRMAMNAKKLRNKEALAVVGLSWVLNSLVGALPFFIDGCIPNYLDALFETISGFTTTGASVIPDLSVLSHCMLFWRSFTHWLGGMGILVFILAVMPGTDGSTFRLLQFESPGPQVGKLTSKVRHTATILYVIYLGLTLAEMIFLYAGGALGLADISGFDSVTLALSTAGTGGFANTGKSIAEFNSLYVEVVIMIFMFLFSLNFNLYYLIILRRIKMVLFDEELRFFVGYVVFFIVAITANLVAVGTYAFGTALRYSSFAVITLTSSTGFATADFAAWPELSRSLLLICMLFGACAGSTGGGIKASRILILGKAARTHLLGVLRPHGVHVVRLNKKMLGEEDVNGVVKYFLVYALIFLVAFLCVSFEGKGINVTLSSVLSCLNNDGPYFAEVASGGAFAGYDVFNPFSKIVFMLLMLIGRLEIFPMLLLFLPHTWSKNY